MTPHRPPTPPPTNITADTTRRHARKYHCRNPVQRWLLRRFFRTVRAWVDEIRPARVLDFGCGEGYFWEQLLRFGPLPAVVGIDLRADAVAAAAAALPGHRFLVCDLLRHEPPAGGYDLAVCSQVLEHLPDPAAHLARLSRLAPQLLLTVPWEPYFQLGNLLRGRDLRRWGNHPEHVQRWTVDGFRRLVVQFVGIEETCTAFPFTLVLGKSRFFDGGGT